jgi:small conductance mechanosensitive channel
MSLKPRLLLALLLSVHPAWAQDEATSETPVALPAETAQELDQSFVLLQRRRAEQERLERQLGQAEGLVKSVLDTRLRQLRTALLEDAQRFATRVADLRDDGYDIGNYRNEAVSRLQSLPGTIRAEVDRLKDAFEFATPEMSAADQAVRDGQFREAVQSIDRMTRALKRNLEISERFGLDIAREREALGQTLEDRAANLSIYLDLTVQEVKDLRSRLTVIPDDEELTAKLNVARGRVNMIAQGLGRVLGLMREFDLETARYQQQVIAATGEITTDILDVRVVGGLAQRAGERVIEWLADNGGQLLVRALFFLGILLVFRFLAQLAERLVERGLRSGRASLSQLLQRTIISTTRNVVLLLGLLIALAQLGIAIGPLLAGLGVAGFILGFALQDTISNFFSGLMILMYRPFDEGDVVDVAGVFGTVRDMSLVSTTVLTFDNQTLIVPNNKIWGDVIKNVTHQRTRRVDLEFGISYSDDIPKAERILAEIVENHEKTLSEPEPLIRLHRLGDSSVTFIVRPWVNTDDYWSVYWDLTREVKMRFDVEGITIPFPQRDVHLHGRTE